MKSKVLGGLLGFCVGDSLGLSVEFKSREELRENPLKDMVGYGTYNQPPGTWSDDSSLTFCLIETLLTGLDLEELGNKFVKWLYEAYWTPNGETFDVGNGTRIAINRLRDGIDPLKAGLDDERSNGNGSLMRILPLVFYLKDSNRDRLHRIIHDVSSLTHRHLRSKLACSIYVEFGISLLEGKTKSEAYGHMKKKILNHFSNYSYSDELNFYERILHDDIGKLTKNQIKSSGYVVDTLEASLWCFLNNNNYKETVIEAVNLGVDTDTIGAIAGGLAGIYYGVEFIPSEWIDKLSKKEEIYDLCIKFYNKLFE